MDPGDIFKRSLARIEPPKGHLGRRAFAREAELAGADWRRRDSGTDASPLPFEPECAGNVCQAILAETPRMSHGLLAPPRYHRQSGGRLVSGSDSVAALTLAVHGGELLVA